MAEGFILPLVYRIIQKILVEKWLRNLSLFNEKLSNSKIFKSSLVKYRNAALPAAGVAWSSNVSSLSKHLEGHRIICSATSKIVIPQSNWLNKKGKSENVSTKKQNITLTKQDLILLIGL